MDCVPAAVALQCCLWTFSPTGRTGNRERFLKISLDLDFHSYRSLLAKLEVASQEQAQLKTALILMGEEDNPAEPVVTVLCELSEADALLEFAKKHCPEAVLDIATSINLARGH